MSSAPAPASQVLDEVQEADVRPVDVLEDEDQRGGRASNSR